MDKQITPAGDALIALVTQIAEAHTDWLALRSTVVAIQEEARRVLAAALTSLSAKLAEANERLSEQLEWKEKLGAAEARIKELEDEIENMKYDLKVAQGHREYVI